MCSIAGMMDLRRDLREHAVCFRAMQESMAHRGPDQNGIFLEPNIALLHNRLSVIDPKNGRQPMTALRGDESYTIVYNGELYNTDELRDFLIREGYDFDTRCDTEVLLKSYIHWGEACLERLNGIFAFAVYEGHNRRLFIARDRMGVKPFFYALCRGAFLFASEIKGLLAHPWVEPVADRNSVREILLTGPGRTPGCGVFRGIEELRPGWCGYYDETGLHIRRYWKLEAREHRDDLETTIETVRELVNDAIRRQLVSDVPIGTFLSGGLDSGIISSLANDYMRSCGRELETFSVDYRDNRRYFQKGKFQPNTDSDYIFPLRDWLGCRHTLVVLDSEELADALYEAVEARGLPGMSDVDSPSCCSAKKSRSTSPWPSPENAPMRSSAAIPGIGTRPSAWETASPGPSPLCGGRNFSGRNTARTSIPGNM